MNKALVNRIIPFSAVDGPGNRTSIFLQGCNFNCLYCHNPETINKCIHCGECVNVCPKGALYYEDNKVHWRDELCVKCDACLKACTHNASPKVKEMSVEDIILQIKKVRPFIEGITVSGGECTLQKDFLVPLFKEVKKLGLTCFVDTNGSIPLYEDNALLQVMDKAMIDLKSYPLEEHKMLTSMENNIVLKNITELSKLDKLYEIRTVVVPELLDNKHNVHMISSLIASLNPNIIYKIIKYRPLGVREEMIHSYTPSKEFMDELYQIAINNGCKNVVIV